MTCPSRCLRPFFSWLADQPDQVDGFSRAMANLTDGIKAGAIASYTFPTPSPSSTSAGLTGPFSPECSKRRQTPPVSCSTSPMSSQKLRPR